MPDHNYFANLIWQIADLLRKPYRPPQYERVMLPMTVLRRFDCVLPPSKAKVLAEHERSKDKFKGEVLDARLNKAAGQRFHNHSPLEFEKLNGDPDHIARETNKLSSVRDETERTIALLKERRAALIAAAVTGQIDMEAAA